MKKDKSEKGQFWNDKPGGQQAGHCGQVEH